MEYCAYSASPVGRYLLDLHGEDPALYKMADPLCDALQILNHLQDCADDFIELDRLYLPEDLLLKAGADSSVLRASQSSVAFRRVVDEVLDGTNDLLRVASGLPGALNSRRLGAESAVILDMAKALSCLLRRRDPLAEQVKLSKLAFGLSALKGLGRLQWLKRGSHHPQTPTEVVR